MLLMTANSYGIVLDDVRSGPAHQPEVDGEDAVEDANVLDDTTVSGGPGDEMSVLIPRPAGAQRQLPEIVHRDGAGWFW